jgi:hypothetical protein
MRLQRTQESHQPQNNTDKSLCTEHIDYITVDVVGQNICIHVVFNDAKPIFLSNVSERLHWTENPAFER